MGGDRHETLRHTLETIRCRSFVAGGARTQLLLGGVGVPGGHLSEQLLGIVLIAGAALRVLLHSRGWTRGSSSGTASVTEK